MSSGSGRRGPIQRAASVLFFCAVSGVALIQAGCMTGIKEYVHNGYKLGPNDQRPKLIRITMTLEDATGRLPDGQTYQYVFQVP